MLTVTADPRVYVACLGCYNAGRLVGAWVDVDEDEDALRESIAGVLKGTVPSLFGTEHDAYCGREEWAFHDYDGFPSGMGEHESVETLCAIAGGILEHGDAFEVWYAWTGRDDRASDPSEWSGEFEDVYRGEHESPAHYAEDLLSDCGDLENLPDSVRYHIDFAAIAEEWRGGSIWWAASNGGGVHVFSN